MVRGDMQSSRDLKQEEIGQIWSIDRSEVIHNIYCNEIGELVLKPEYYNMSGWPSGEPEKYTPLLVECFERGGWFHGIFDEGKLIGVVILESKFIDAHKDTLQLKFLHVDNKYRKQGLGKQLFALASNKAREKNAKKMYISATPSENTIKFYLGQGCVVATEPDPELFELEPEDIHLVYEI